MKKFYAIMSLLVVCYSITNAQCCTSHSVVVSNSSDLTNMDLLLEASGISKASFQRIEIPKMVRIFNSNEQIVNEKKLNEIWKYQLEYTHLLSKKWQINGAIPVATIDPIFGESVTTVSDAVVSATYSLINKQQCDTMAVRPTLSVFTGIKIPLGEKLAFSPNNELGDLHTGSWDGLFGSKLFLQWKNWGYNTYAGYTVRANDYNGDDLANVLQCGNVLSYTMSPKGIQLKVGSGLNMNRIMDVASAETNAERASLTNYYWNAILQASVNKWLVSMETNNSIQSTFKDTAFLSNPYQKVSISYIH